MNAHLKRYIKTRFVNLQQLWKLDQWTYFSKTYLETIISSQVWA